LDSVGVALTDLLPGETAAGIALRDKIPQGHKFALTDIRDGEPVIKYGNPIGVATRDIGAGEHAHTHNIRTNLKEDAEYAYEPVGGRKARGNGGTAGGGDGEIAGGVGKVAGDSGLNTCNKSFEIVAKFKYL
jgi:altronate dehydratase